MSKLPDYDVVMEQRTEGDQRGPRQNVGAAWKIIKRDGSDTGGINISINLPVQMSPDWRLTLWPRRDNGGGQRRAPSQPTQEPNPPDEFGDDDIPF